MNVYFYLVLAVCVAVGNAQRYMPYTGQYYGSYPNPYYGYLQRYSASSLYPDPMPRYKQVASVYEQYTGRQAQVTDDGVRVGDNLNNFWLLCQGSNCGRG